MSSAPSETTKTVAWLKAHWFLLVAIACGGVAWGSQENKVAKLEDAVKRQIEIDARVREQGEKSAAIDERTKMMQRMMEEQQKLLIEVLREVKK